MTFNRKAAAETHCYRKHHCDALTSRALVLKSHRFRRERKTKQPTTAVTKTNLCDRGTKDLREGSVA